MKTYIVYYKVKDEEKTLKVEADDLFELDYLLQTKYLYRKQYNSVYKIEVI